MTACIAMVTRGHYMYSDHYIAMANKYSGYGNNCTVITTECEKYVAMETE
jgi:hypothetical protein